VEFKVDGFVKEILDLNQYFSESDLNDVLSTNLDSVDHFLTKIEKMELTPYTKIRYCLYISNDEIFSHDTNGISEREHYEIKMSA
jgi:putative GTP pyrophosphokinase